MVDHRKGGMVDHRKGGLNKIVEVIRSQRLVSIVIKLIRTPKLLVLWGKYNIYFIISLLED